jgi:excisionase family DNA binding protein
MKSSDQDVDDDAPTLEYRVPARPIAVRTATLPDVLNSREAATALRMGVKELRQLIERGELPAARLGPRRVIRIAKTAILSLLRGEPCKRPLVPPADAADATVEPCKPARRRWKGRPS